jgi:hypothetical protein
LNHLVDTGIPNEEEEEEEDGETMALQKKESHGGKKRSRRQKKVNCKDDPLYKIPQWSTRFFFFASLHDCELTPY